MRITTEPGIYEQIECGFVRCRVCWSAWPSGRDEEHRSTCIVERYEKQRVITSMLMAFANRVAFDPIGDPESSAEQILSTLTENARATIAKAREYAQADSEEA